MDDLGKISLALLALMTNSGSAQSSVLLLIPCPELHCFLGCWRFTPGLYKEDVTHGMVSLGSQ